MIDTVNNRKLFSFRLLVCAAAAFLLVSCASVSHYEKIDAAVLSGNYDQGLTLVNEAKGKGYRDKDAVVYYLDAGMISHFAGSYEKSSEYLQEAEKSIEAAFTKSISLEAATFLVNDTMREYPGEDYEDLYLNVFNALNYYHRENMEGAMVEVRRMDNKIRYLSTKYGTVLTKAQQDLLKKDSGIPYDKEAARVEFTNSALARYLGMLFYRAEGKRDDARIDRDQVRLAFANQPAMYDFPLPETLDEELSIPREKARINVLGFSGRSPLKAEKVTRIPISGSNWIKISIPEFRERPSRVARTVVSLDSGENFELELIEKLGTVARETFKQRAAIIYVKTILRSLTKTTSSALLDEGASHADDPGAALLLGLLSLGTQVYAEASEQADLRMSRYFPDRAHVGGITVDPGVYTVTVTWYDSGNNLVQQTVYDGVEIKSNRLNLLEAVCMQ